MHQFFLLAIAALASGSPAPQGKMPRLIALEEHFYSSTIGNPDGYDAGVFEKLQDLGPIRLEHMDKNSVTFQVISHAPGLGAAFPKVCSSANDQLAAAISKNKP